MRSLLGIGICLLALIFSYWPLALMGLCILAWWGNGILALMTATFFELLWGAPVGRLHMLYAPFLLTTFAGVFLRITLSRLLRIQYIDRL